MALRKDGKGSAGSLAINIPKEILTGVGVGLVLLMVTIHLLLGIVWLMGAGRLAHDNEQWQKILPDKIVIDAIKKESGSLTKKIKTIADLTIKKSVLWAPKFNAIGDSLPRGVWITKMTLDKVGLTIEGSVVSKNQNEINNVGLLLSALKQNDGFMNGFSSLEENSIQGGKNNSIEVTDFSVMAKLK